MTAKIGKGISNTSWIGGSAYGQNTIATTIVRLLKSGCPPAVVLGIALFVINPVQAHSFRLFPHIGQEVFKRIQPPLANSYASPTPIFVAGALRVVTPNPHICPYLIGFTQRHSMREVLAPSAGFSSASLQVGIVANRLSSTDTTTDTKGLAMAARGISNDCKLAEGLSDQRRFSRHSIGSVSALFSSALRVTPDACCDYAQVRQCLKG